MPCDTLSVMELKTCCVCLQQKSLDDFHYYKDRPDQQNRAARCKPCTAEYSAKWYAANRERMKENMRATAYMRKYGITVEEYEILLAEQNNGCAICAAPTGAGGKRLAVDHNHQTNAVRGLLCDQCNTGLGMFKDSIDLLITAANYLADYDE